MKILPIHHNQQRSSSYITTGTTIIFTVLLAMLSLGLTGCTSMAVWLGWKVPLDRISIASISAALPQGSGIVPGHKSQLVVSVTEPDGKVLQAEGIVAGQVYGAISPSQPMSSVSTNME